MDSTARSMLNSGDPVNISVCKSDGTILELRNYTYLRYEFYGGWRNVKLLSSGECRKIRDCCISVSTTLKYSFDFSQIIRTFAQSKYFFDISHILNYEKISITSVSLGDSVGFYFV